MSLPGTTDPVLAAAPTELTARNLWRARLGLETGGPGWPAPIGPGDRPLSPTAELTLLAVRQLRAELAAELAALNRLLGAGGIDARRQWWISAGAA